MRPRPRWQTLPQNSALSSADRHEVRLSARAAKSVRKLDGVAQRKILLALSLLETTPRPPTALALSGHPGLLRVRVGNYRIIYSIEDDILVVHVLEVGHRREIYRAL